MGEVGSEHRSFETTRLAVELAGAIMQARGGEWSVEEAISLTRGIRREISALLGDSQRDIEPAVPVAQSIESDWLICLEDGKRLKLLKRYLKSHYNMTPEEYRRKWGLPADYPMAAPSYSEERSAMARKIGLGKKRAS